RPAQRSGVRTAAREGAVALSAVARDPGHPRMAWIYWLSLWRLMLGPPFSEPSIAGESGA
ncbi:hypothetical protein NZA43_10805, partial [Escherichia coli]|uniref:hypothetical protein n=1 Tax=Escherichia coli TaxID=562 RepID=UPI0022F0A129